MTAEVGTVSISTVATPNITLAADAGSFTLTGQDVTITSSVIVVSLDLGSFTLTGQDVDLDIFETLTVTVQNTGYGNKYFIDGSETPTLTLYEGVLIALTKVTTLIVDTLSDLAQPQTVRMEVVQSIPRV